MSQLNKSFHDHTSTSQPQVSKWQSGMPAEKYHELSTVNVDVKVKLQTTIKSLEHKEDTTHRCK